MGVDFGIMTQWRRAKPRDLTAGTLTVWLPSAGSFVAAERLHPRLARAVAAHPHVDLRFVTP